MENGHKLIKYIKDNYLSNNEVKLVDLTSSMNIALSKFETVAETQDVIVHFADDFVVFRADTGEGDTPEYHVGITKLDTDQYVYWKSHLPIKEEFLSSNNTVFIISGDVEEIQTERGVSKIPSIQFAIFNDSISGKLNIISYETAIQLGLHCIYRVFKHNSDSNIVFFSAIDTNGNFREFAYYTIYNDATKEYEDIYVDMQELLLENKDVLVKDMEAHNIHNALEVFRPMSPAGDNHYAFVATVTKERVNTVSEDLFESYGLDDDEFREKFINTYNAELKVGDDGVAYYEYKVKVNADDEIIFTRINIDHYKFQKPTLSITLVEKDRENKPTLLTSDLERGYAWYFGFNDKEETELIQSDLIYGDENRYNYGDRNVNNIEGINSVNLYKYDTEKNLFIVDIAGPTLGKFELHDLPKIGVSPSTNRIFFAYNYTTFTHVMVYMMVEDKLYRYSLYYTKFMKPDHELFKDEFNYHNSHLKLDFPDDHLDIDVDCVLDAINRRIDEIDVELSNEEQIHIVKHVFINLTDNEVLSEKVPRLEMSHATKFVTFQRIGIPGKMTIKIMPKGANQESIDLRKEI